MSIRLRDKIQNKVFYNIIHNKNFISMFKITRAINSVNILLESDYIEKNNPKESFDLFCLFSKERRKFCDICDIYIRSTPSENMNHQSGKFYYFDKYGSIIKIENIRD